MANEQEYDTKLEVYYIPPNYEDAGGLLGGKFKTRNGIEMAVICGPVAFLEYKLLHFGWETNIIIAMVTIIPLLCLTAFGINGESLSQILFAFIRFRKKRRKLSYTGFSSTQKMNGKISKLSFLIDSIASVGFKKTMENIKLQKAKDEQEKTNRQIQEKVSEFEANLDRNTKANRGKSKIVTGAAKEMLLRKLDLGDDSEEEW